MSGLLDAYQRDFLNAVCGAVNESGREDVAIVDAEVGPLSFNITIEYLPDNSQRTLNYSRGTKISEVAAMFLSYLGGPKRTGEPKKRRRAIRF